MLPDPAHRRAAVEAALDAVLDPELDEPLTDLGFIHGVEIVEASVVVTLRLPTFWCSANFAYIMGEDILAAVGDLPWVERATCRLVDHFAMKRVNDGLARGLSFREAFAGEANADLEAVRSDFHEKSFIGRQATLIQALRREKRSPAEIVALTIGELETRATQAGPDHARQIARYLEARRSRPAPQDDAALAFLTIDGAPVCAGRLLDHLREARRIRGSFEANAEMCRILHAARYGANAAPEPTQPAGKREEFDEHD